MLSEIVLTDGRRFPGYTTPTGMAVDIREHEAKGFRFFPLNRGGGPNTFVAIAHIASIEPTG